MNFSDALDFLENASIFGIKPGLERISRLLFLLNDPQKKFPTLHVAGTNGKGSVSAMLESICREEGLKTGLFTSPHLVNYRERIRINGEWISEKKFASGIEKISRILQKSPDLQATQFEILTALAFLIFAEESIDVGIIEVGLGGLLDSTNVIIPRVSIITNIAEDHADKCIGEPGDSLLEGIARHKAGIIKREIPIVTAARDESLEIIISQARKLNAPISIYQRDFFSTEYDLNLRGEYQIENASVASEAARVFGISEDSIRAGLKKVRWSGRFEVVNYRGRRVIIDGAHNPAGARALRASLDREFPNQNRIFLIGILRDKKFAEMLEILLCSGDSVIATSPDSPRAATADEIFQTASRFSNRVEIGDFNHAFEISDSDSIIIVTGSLYLIGKIRDEVTS